MSRLVYFGLGVLTGVFLARRGAAWTAQIREQGVIESSRRIGVSAGKAIQVGRTVLNGSQGSHP